MDATRAWSTHPRTASQGIWHIRARTRGPFYSTWFYTIISNNRLGGEGLRAGGGRTSTAEGRLRVGAQFDDPTFQSSEERSRGSRTCGGAVFS